jgi:hypothetical protein
MLRRTYPAGTAGTSHRFLPGAQEIHMKSHLTLTELAVELGRQLPAKKDMIVGSALLRHETRSGTTSVTVPEASGLVRYGLTPLARRQLADKLHIPFAYFERMRESAPELLDANVNRWLHEDTDRRLLRILDGQVRAVLSDRYRRLDNCDLAEAILPVLQALPGLRFESVALTETRMYLKCVSSRTQAEVQPGDVVQAGLVISNSEVGEGTLSVQPLLYRLVCRNGMILPDRSLRKTHVGRVSAFEDADRSMYCEETLRAEDKAFFMKVRDVVRSAISELGLQQHVQRLQKLLGIRMGAGAERTVEVLAQRYGLTDAERGGVLQELVASAQMTGYGLVNAVTHFSQRVEDYDRATEFEALGGRLIELGAAEWSALGAAS